MIKKLFSLCFLLIFTSCASITESKYQSVSVTTGNVTGAMCELSNSKGTYYINETPGTVQVKNACDPLSVICKKKGYVPADLNAGTVKDKAKAMAWGNLIFGGIIGIAVDRSSGAGCEYAKSTIVYRLKKEE